MSELDGKRAIQYAASADTPGFSVDDEEIAQWVVDETETKVGRDGSRLAVVLDEVLQEHARRERDVCPQRHQIGLEQSFGEIDVVSRPRQLGQKMDAVPIVEADPILAQSAGPEVSTLDAGVEGHTPPP